MARPLRIEYAGAKYHVMARGNQGRSLFRDDEDRHRWLATLGEACAKTGWRVHAYVLMNNHYHLLLETPEANLVAGMKLREQAGQRLRGQQRESHSGPVRREHGEQAAEQLLGRALVALGLTEADLASKPKVTPAKAALARWLREQTTVSLRWVGARLNLGHYSNAGRSPRKMRPADVRQLKQCQRQLESVAASPA
jgi:REP element-mobilizing transposase RayT